MDAPTKTPVLRAPAAQRRRAAGAAVLLVLAVLAASMAAAPARAQLLSDSEARKAILELRERVAADQQLAQRQLAELRAQRDEQLGAMRRSLLDLDARLAQLRDEIRALRGDNEALRRDVAALQQRLADGNQALDERLRRMEPQEVSVDGIAFQASPAERRDWDVAMGKLREGDFGGAATALTAFLKDHPDSGYQASAQFWLGNALYGKRDYKGAVAALRAMTGAHPEHPKAAEAMLALANSQAESKDTAGARRTLQDLLKRYPESEAAAAGKERLAALR